MTRYQRWPWVLLFRMSHQKPSSQHPRWRTSQVGRLGPMWKPRSSVTSRRSRVKGQPPCQGQWCCGVLVTGFRAYVLQFWSLLLWISASFCFSMSLSSCKRIIFFSLFLLLFVSLHHCLCLRVLILMRCHHICMFYLSLIFISLSCYLCKSFFFFFLSFFFFFVSESLSVCPPDCLSVFVSLSLSVRLSGSL